MKLINRAIRKQEMNLLRMQQTQNMINAIEQGESYSTKIVCELLKELLEDVRVDLPDICPELFQKISEIIKSGGYFKAISEYRQATGEGLLESKLFIDNLRKNLL